MCSSWCTQEFDAALELIDQHLKSGVAEYPLYVKALIRRQRGAARARLLFAGMFKKSQHDLSPALCRAAPQVVCTSRCSCFRLRRP